MSKEKKPRFATRSENKKLNAQVVDQETQIRSVHTLSDKDHYDTPILPGAAIVDKDVEEKPFEKGPVREPEKEDDYSNTDADLLNPVDADTADHDFNQPENAEEEKAESDNGETGEPKEKELTEAEKDAIGPEVIRTATRYGNGKEVPLEMEEDVAASRHYPPAPHGTPTGTVNEWPR